MTYTTVVMEKNDRVAKITLNRPEAMNALSTLLRQELSAAIAEVERDDEVDVLILTGAGRAFCAGLDLKELGQGLNMALATGPSSPWARLRAIPKPTIAAVNGYAITGGFELALNCDMIIASTDARFADTHARVGLVPGEGLSQLLPRLVGIKKAKELSFTGNYLTAQEALQFGLVNRVVPPEELPSSAEGLARDILGCDQAIVRKMKKLIDAGEGMTVEQALTMERAEHLAHRIALTPADVERRRQDVMDRGRAQVHKG